MSRPMNFHEFVEVLTHIQTRNAPLSRVNRNLPVVKYVDPVFDMRTNTVFSITFRGWGSDITFHCANEYRDHPKSLKDRVLEYLTTERGGASVPKPVWTFPEDKDAKCWMVTKFWANDRETVVKDNLTSDEAKALAKDPAVLADQEPFGLPFTIQVQLMTRS